MGPIGVCIGHENDLAIAGGIYLEATTGSGADDLDDCGALRVFQHVAHGGLLHVEDLAPDG